jgi:hypothetical protein
VEVSKHWMFQESFLPCPSSSAQITAFKVLPQVLLFLESFLYYFPFLPSLS